MHSRTEDEGSEGRRNPGWFWDWPVGLNKGSEWSWGVAGSRGKISNLKMPNRHVGGSTEGQKHFIKIVRQFPRLNQFNFLSLLPSLEMFFLSLLCYTKMLNSRLLWESWFFFSHFTAFGLTIFSLICVCVCVCVCGLYVTTSEPAS